MALEVIANSTEQQQEGSATEEFLELEMSKEGKRKKNPNSIQKFFTKTITILSLVEICSAAVISITGPIYPDAAKQRGSSAIEVGAVFGIFGLTNCLLSPIFGNFIGIVGPKPVFNLGIVVSGISCMLFGMLNGIKSRSGFFWLSLLLRFTHAMGDAAFTTASFTITNIEFPGQVGKGFAIIETAHGLGFIIGPLLGSLLYQFGGYELPFLIFGAILAMAAIPGHFFMPEPSQTQKFTTNSANEKIPASATTKKPEEHARAFVDGLRKIMRFLAIPEVALNACNIIIASAGAGYIVSNLDLHLNQFHLNKFSVGLIFTANSFVYAGTTLLLSLYCKKANDRKATNFFATIVTVAGLIVIGPIPQIPYEPSIALTMAGLVLCGCGLGITLTNSFQHFSNDANAHGYPKDMSTYGLVSGIWNSMSSLGNCIGEFIFGGVAVDNNRFRDVSLIIITGHVLMAVCYQFILGYLQMKPQNTEHNERPQRDKDDAA